MNAKELYDLKPFGALVRYSDGTPKPPARHTKKVADWEKRNGQGFFVQANPPYDHEGSVASITLKLIQSDHFHYNQGFSVNSSLNFEVEMPAPGTVMTYSPWRDDIEIANVHANYDDYLAWCVRNRYSPFGHGRKLWIVGEDGKLKDFTEADAPVSV